MTFWEIREPAASDYKHVHLSGKLEHPYRLPAVECEKCGTSVCRYYDVVLPFECPVSFRENHLLTDNIPTQRSGRAVGPHFKVVRLLLDADYQWLEQSAIDSANL